MFSLLDLIIHCLKGALSDKTNFLGVDKFWYKARLSGNVNCNNRRIVANHNEEWHSVHASHYCLFA